MRGKLRRREREGSAEQDANHSKDREHYRLCLRDLPLFYAVGQ
jgi:hypothetical protein